MSSDNPSGADNQQETVRSMLTLDPRWITGFVDGEGCFSVSVHRNAANCRSTGGWQLHPTFHVYQHERHRAVLEALITAFGCGKLRTKGVGSTVMTFAVDRLSDLHDRVIPFFEEYELVVKQRDFDIFAGIVRAMVEKQHLHRGGFERLVRLAYEMNLDGKQRKRSIDEILTGSSETARQAPAINVRSRA